MTRPANQREQQRRRTRRLLAESALRLFAERGYDETTVDDIAAAAGVSARTFFLHFPTKAAAVFPDHNERVADFVAQLASGAPEVDPISHLLATITANWETNFPLRRLRYRLLAEIPALRDEDARTDRDYERAIADHLIRAWGSTSEARLRANITGNAVIAVIRAVLVAWSEEDFDVAAVCNEALYRMFGSPVGSPLQSL